MHKLAAYLLKYEKINGEDFEKLMRGENIEKDDEISVPSDAEPAEA